VLYRAFLCSLIAAIVLKALNPTGTGKLVLFETNYGVNYEPIHYLVFIFLGIVGGLFGGIFCRANFLWSKSFRKYSIIKNHPVFELSLVVLVTALLQFPNPLTREPGDIILKSVLVDCRQPEGSWICVQEEQHDRTKYYGWLLYGTTVKLILTIITFGCKVPSGIIIPALDAGALFGRLVGQAIPDISPGIFAMVGAAAFLAGISRMTVSLAVIMFELTGEVDYIPPFMIAILIAKWVADALSSEGVYDLAQTVLGHPFLDPDHALHIVRNEGSLVEELIPPPQTMNEITVNLPADLRVPKSLLLTKLAQLKARGLMDAGLVLVSNGMLHGYLAEGELEFVLSEPGVLDEEEEMVDLLQGPIAAFVDRTPLTVCGKAPMEVAVQMFGALGLRYLVVVAEGSGRVEGVVIKKRLVWYLEGLKRE
jgi:chloride channel 3/4/5